MEGPYTTDYGQDAYGHPTNRYGRCAQLNTTNVCPNAVQQTTYLLGIPNVVVIEIAQGLGITVNPNPLLSTNAILVPLIIAIQFP